MWVCITRVCIQIDKFFLKERRDERDEKRRDPITRQCTKITASCCFFHLFNSAEKSVHDFGSSPTKKSKSGADGESSIVTQNSFLSWRMPRFSIHVEKKSIRRLRISVVIFCEIAERVASPGAGGNGTIHRFVATLLAARTLSILRDLRYYATSSTSNSTLSLRDFGHKFLQAPSSTLTPTLLDL